MNTYAANQIPGRAAPAGSLRAVSRWIVEHQGVVGLIIPLLVTALCLGQWWRAFPQAQAQISTDPESGGEPTAFLFFSIVGWLLLLGAAGWLGLYALSIRQSGAPKPVRHPKGWDFRTGWRQRVFNDRPVGQGWLWLHGLFGVVGFALGVGLTLRVATAVAWHVPSQSHVVAEFMHILIVLLAIWVMVLATRRIHDVLYLHQCDDFVGDRANLPAQRVAMKESAKAEAERQQEMNTVSLGVFVILVGGVVAGLWLANRWLPAAAESTVILGCACGLIGGATVPYLLMQKPRGWPVWLGLVVFGVVGILLFALTTAEASPLHWLPGLLWGAGLGVSTTLLHLREVRQSQVNAPSTTRTWN